MSVVVDTSSWIDFFDGREMPALEEALAQGLVILPPVVVAELVSGAIGAGDREAISDLVRELPVHSTDVDHWIRVGELRRHLRGKGLSVSTPDAHVAQCAMDLDAALLTQDSIFARISRLSKLRLSGRT